MESEHLPLLRERVNLTEMLINRYPILPKYIETEQYYLMPFSVTSRPPGKYGPECYINKLNS